MFVFLALLSCVLGVVSSSPWYVATNGSDTNGDGAIDNPYASIYRASKNVSPGDFILVREGVYSGVGSAMVTLTGAANAFITLSAYKGEKAVIDGSELNNSEYDGMFHLYQSSYVNVTGFEIRNSKGAGFVCDECENVELNNNFIHQITSHAITGVGDYITIENNEVSFAALNNINDKFGTGGWPGTIMSWRKPDNSKCRNWVIRGNYVHDCWGEGIIADIDGAIIQNNIVRDTYSVNIYIDGGLGASNLIVDSNFLFSTNATYFRFERPASGIEFSTETYPFSTFPVLNVVISNNLMVRTGVGLSYWHDPANTNATSNTYSNISFIYNVIWEPYADAISIEGIPEGYEQPSFGRVWNNIISNGSCNIGNEGVWEFSHNNWVSGIPEIAQDKYSFSADPMFLNATINAGPEGFKLSSKSSSIGKAIPTAFAAYDFWGHVRSSNAPTVGIYEP